MKLAMRLPEKSQGHANDVDPRDTETTEVIDLASRTSYPAVANRGGNRDALGLAVDMVIDPLRFALPSGDYDWTLAARGAARFADAAEYADIIDANVINTTEPYLQARLLYLQTRRYHLGIQAEDDIIDPYADF